MNNQNNVNEVLADGVANEQVEQKHWLDSTTIRYNLLAVIPTVYSICKLFGIEIPDGTLESLADGIAAVITVVSIFGVFFGRIKADKPLGFSPKK